MFRLLPRVFVIFFMAQLLWVAQALAIVVYWEPAAPVPGGDVTIYYNVIEGTLPNDTDPVYIHLGYNGWQDTQDYAMTEDADGWWHYEYSIPADAYVVDFVFTDLQGNWDNNGGIGVDWHIGLNITWEPLNPNPNDVVHMTVRNTDQGGDVIWYVGTGPYFEPPIEDYWPAGSQLTADGSAIASPLQGPDGDGNYTLELGPFTNAEQLVDVIKFEIQWADGTWEGSLYDITLDYTPAPGDPTVDIVTPEDDQLIDGPTQINVEATDAETVEIWAAGELLEILTVPPYQTTWNPNLDNFGDHIIIAKAINDEGRVTFDQVQVRIVPEVVSEPAPPGTDDGVNIDGNEVTIALYAPGKDFIALKGSFNEDEYPNGELMKVSGDTLWWATYTLPDGEYLYQYNIDGIKYIADPWSKDVEWKDPNGGWESGDYQHAKTRFVVGQEEFEWTDQDFVRPPIDNLVIYEMHVSDFVGYTDGTIGTYLEVIDKIEEGYFDSLGVNVVELMPVNEFEGENSWGYNPSFYMAPETAYGTPEELKMLVNKFHEHDIAVMLDVVFNHMWGSAPLFQLYQPLGNYNYEDHDYDNCPYFENDPSPWGYRLEHWHYRNGRHYRTWKHVTDALRTWVEEYHFDGFRYDHTEGIGWWGYDEEGMSFYSAFVDELGEDIIQIAEEDNALRINNSGIDGGWNYSYFHALKANLQQISDAGFNWGNMSSLSYQISTSEMQAPYAPLSYIESHDETRVIYEATAYQGMNYETALKKSKLGMTVLMTSRCTPMIYAGQELAQNDTSRDPDGNIMPQPMQWENLETPEGQDLFAYYQRLIELRQNRPVLRSDDISFHLMSSDQKSIVYWRETSADIVVVAANFNNQDEEIMIDFPSSGMWYEFTEQDSIMVDNDMYSYPMPASTARIFFGYRYWLDIEDDTEAPQIVDIQLRQNYPNPVMSGQFTQIRYQLPAATPVTLKVYNAAGQFVRTLADQKQAAGVHDVQWDGRNEAGQIVGSGVYFYRLETPEETHQRRMVLIR